jgi:hypothetical protein
MADNLIQIKRSLTTAIPGSLSAGELAYTANGDILYIGSPTGDIVAIGGKRNPGVLTANQALVANSTSWIDSIKVASLEATNIVANGQSGPAGTVLASDGDSTYWLDITTISVGAQYIQNTDSRVLSGNLHLTGANTVIDNLTVTAGTIKGVSPTITLSGDLSGNVTLTDLANGTLSASLTKVIALGTDTSGDYVEDITAGDGVSVTSGTGVGSNPTIAVVAGTGVTSNATGVHIGQDVGTTSSVTFGGLDVNGDVNLGASATNTITPVGRFDGSLTPSANVTYDLGTPNLRWRDLWVGGSSIHIGDATITSSSGNTITVGNVTIGDNDLAARNATLSGNVYVSGDLVVSGNLAFVNVETVQVKDPLILLGSNNTVGDIVDLGFYGTYNSGTQEYAGLFRDASDGVFKLFKGLDVQPGATVDTTDPSYQVATIEAFFKQGGFTANATHAAITASANYDVQITANTLTLATALATGSGGTGQSTYSTGDLLVGTSGGSLAKLGLGTAGYVLQSNGTALVYDTLDGGTF